MVADKHVSSQKRPYPKIHPVVLTTVYYVSDKPKFLIFVKLTSQNVFTPCQIMSRTVSGLLKKLEAKFPDSIRPQFVDHVYQRSAKNLTFHLTDDMMELMTPNQVFDVEVKQNEANDNIELTLIEVEQGL